MTGGRDALFARLEALARAYLPQWNCDLDGPELESALLAALGVLLEEGEGRLRALPARRETEFLRGFGEERRGGLPSWAWAALSAPEERSVPAGTAFYLSGDGKRVWRTDRDARAGPVRLAAHFLTGGGKVLPLPLPGAEGDAPLFDFRAPGIARHEARFSHPDAFASLGGCRVTLTLERDGLMDFLADGASWFLEGGEGLLPVSPVRDGERALSFALPPSPGGRALRVRAPDGAVPPPEALGRLTVSTARTGLSCGAVLTDDGPCALPDGGFLPFGESPERWRSCYIACEDALSLRGAEAVLSWTASFQDRTRLLPGLEGTPEYKLVMRSLPPIPPEPRDACADSVAWEYWNGQGWMPVPGAEEYAAWFGPEGPSGRCAARFRWPEDAEPREVLGVTARWLRWRVRSAEGQGFLPRRDHAPRAENLRFSAVLENAPVAVERACGLDGAFTPAMAREPLFPSLAGPEDAWWLGFDPPPGGGTLSLYLAFRGGTPGGTLSAWEGFGAGERPLALEDGTEGLAHDGALAVSGFAGGPCTRFGRRLWWLCLRPEGGSLREAPPVLTRLFCGAVRLVSEGADGCVPGEALQPLRGGVVSGGTLTGGFGGAAAEGEAEWVRRAEARRRFLGRAVSPADVEELLRDAFPGVVRSRCVRTGNRMDVAVLLRDVLRHDDALALRREDLRRLLEERSALPSLGLAVRVRPPVFYPIRAAVWVRPAAGADFSETRRALLDALAAFLNPVSGNFHGGGWRIGALPTDAQLAGCLRAAAPEAADFSCTAETPEGAVIPASAVRDPFALPLDSGDHTIREAEP